jgi:hypothetical protein
MIFFLLDYFLSEKIQCQLFKNYIKNNYFLIRYFSNVYFYEYYELIFVFLLRIDFK